MAAVAALAGAPGPHLFSDALNHASIIDGARAAQRAGACLHVFRHRDMGHLEELLAAAPPGRDPCSACQTVSAAVPPPDRPPLLFCWWWFLGCIRSRVRKLAVGPYGLCWLEVQGCTARSEILSSEDDQPLSSLILSTTTCSRVPVRKVCQKLARQPDKAFRVCSEDAKGTAGRAWHIIRNFTFFLGHKTSIQTCMHDSTDEDVPELRMILCFWHAPHAGARLLVVTDSLFSMDGTWADLRGLAALRAKHGFLLIIDEAHASLVTGSRCAGTLAAPGQVTTVTCGPGHGVDSTPAHIQHWPNEHHA